MPIDPVVRAIAGGKLVCCETDTRHGVMDAPRGQMPRIGIIPLGEAKGLLKQQYEAAVKRAGRVWNIVSLMSRNPRTMKASMDFYGVLMHGPSALSRGRREMLAVVVSARNHCVY